jgi:signal transduction histidine kinase
MAREVTESLRALAPHIHLELPDSDEAMARGNEDELREALVNVIDNARKYAPGSPVDVRVSKAANVVVLEVVDAGPGMSAADQVRAFERFQRGSANPDVEGSGLGLAIAKRAVERAGGQITLGSALGSGTTVTMYLPAAESEVKR